jgi:hypothetical protein
MEIDVRNALVPGMKSWLIIGPGKKHYCVMYDTSVHYVAHSGVLTIAVLKYQFWLVSSFCR